MYTIDKEAILQIKTFDIFLARKCKLLDFNFHLKQIAALTPVGHDLYQIYSSFGKIHRII